MPRFAANLGYLFTDRPLLERIDAAAACGFKAIELQFPYDVPASAVKAAIARNRLTMLGINTPPGEREGEFGLAAVPGREKDFAGLFARALDYAVTIGGSAVHCLAGKVALEQRPAAERVFIDNLKMRRRSRRRKEHHAADRADQRPRPAELFSQPRRARRRHHRQGGQAQHQDAVRFLSRADRRRRSASTGWKSTCRSSAICNAPPCPRATSRTRARSITATLFEAVDRLGYTRLDRRRIPAALPHRGRPGLGAAVWRGSRALTPD